MGYEHEFRQVPQPRKTAESGWLGEVGEAVMGGVVELLPDSLGLVALAVIMTIGLVWLLRFLLRHLISMTSGH